MRSLPCDTSAVCVHRSYRGVPRFPLGELARCPPDHPTALAHGPLIVPSWEAFRPGRHFFADLPGPQKSPAAQEVEAGTRHLRPRCGQRAVAKIGLLRRPAGSFNGRRPGCCKPALFPSRTCAGRYLCSPVCSPPRKQCAKGRIRYTAALLL